MMRCLIGVVAILRPRLAAAPWVGGEEARRVSSRVLGRALGGRDLMLGVGALTASTTKGLARATALGAIADGIDYLTTLRDFKRLPRLGRYAVAISTLAGALTGALLTVVLRELDDSEDERLIAERA
jgi:hypothetical protein